MSGTLVKWRVPISILVACACLVVPFFLSSVPLTGSVKMSPIKNVAVAGGTGNLGSRVVSELVKAGFKVTVLSRLSSDSNATLPDGVTLRKVDYGSVDSIRPAVEGQDAVVSVLGTFAVGFQQPLVDASLAAGVKRFIPSEFGVNTRKAIGKPLGKLLLFKIQLVDYLEAKAKENPNFTWTGISIGLFFDSSLEKGWLPYNLATRTATVHDSGNEPSQHTNLYFAGRAVAGVLQHPAETANKYLEVSSFNPSQNDIVRILEEFTGATWTTNRVDTKELQRQGEEKVAKGDFSAFPALLSVVQYQDGIGNAPGPGVRANELLGLPGEEDLRAQLKAWVEKNTA